MNLHRLLVVALAVLLVGTAGAAAAPGNAPDDAGPPADLPNPVPDFVGDIHDAIGSFIDGTVDHLGSVVSDLTPGDDGADRNDGAQGETTDGA